MKTEEVMRERAMLIGWKFSHGLTADESARLDWLDVEARRLCPRVTPEMKAEMAAFQARTEARQERRKAARGDRRDGCAVCGWGSHMAIHMPVKDGPRAGQPWGHAYKTPNVGNEPTHTARDHFPGSRK